MNMEPILVELAGNARWVAWILLFAATVSFIFSVISNYSARYSETDEEKALERVWEGLFLKSAARFLALAILIYFLVPSPEAVAAAFAQP